MECFAAKQCEDNGSKKAQTAEKYKITRNLYSREVEKHMAQVFQVIRLIY